MARVTRLGSALLIAFFLFPACGFEPAPPRAARGTAGTVYVVDDERYVRPGLRPEYLWIGFDSPDQWNRITSHAIGTTVSVGGRAIRDSSTAGFHLDPATTLADVGGVPEAFHPIGDVAPILDQYPGQDVFVILTVRLVALDN
jgi:hypothetical protein